MWFKVHGSGLGVGFWEWGFILFQGCRSKGFWGVVGLGLGF